MTHSQKRLDGKIAVITGRNSGIGLATAERFVKEGAYVFITGRRQSEVDNAIKEIGRNIAHKKFETAGVSIFHFKDNKIKEAWTVVVQHYRLVLLKQYLTKLTRTSEVCDIVHRIGLMDRTPLSGSRRLE